MFHTRTIPSIVRWQNEVLGWNPDLRHIQCFIAVSGRSDSTEHKSVECKVCTLEEFFLWPKFKMAAFDFHHNHNSVNFLPRVMILVSFPMFLGARNRLKHVS